jgi:hypothetical protein
MTVHAKLTLAVGAQVGMCFYYRRIEITPLQYVPMLRISLSVIAPQKSNRRATRTTRTSPDNSDSTMLKERNLLFTPERYERFFQ